MKNQLGRVWHFIVRSDSVDVAEASDLIVELRERKEKLEIATEEARALLKERRQFLDSADTIAAFAAEMSEFLKTSELTEAKAFVGSFVKEVVVKPGRAAIVYSIPTPASPARTPSTTGAVDAPTATVAPRPTATTAPPADSGSAETDREALVALYNATGGENWSISANWLSDAPLDEWEGVRTNDDGRVTELDLFSNGLSGEIPAELGSLSNLTHLYLRQNDLSGCIPSSLRDHWAPTLLPTPIVASA